MFVGFQVAPLDQPTIPLDALTNADCPYQRSLESTTRENLIKDALGVLYKCFMFMSVRREGPKQPQEATLNGNHVF